MVPVSVAPANQYADTPSGIPDPTTKGPDWILIGTEGGFMPKPVVVPQQPIGYNLDPAYFNFGIVNQHSLFLGCAERADVVVDFSAYAGKTLILYNDSPAPVPAGAAPYDFYTGNGTRWMAAEQQYVRNEARRWMSNTRSRGWSFGERISSARQTRCSSPGLTADRKGSVSNSRIALDRQERFQTVARTLTSC